MILPIGLLNQQHRLAASQEDVVFRGNWCDRNNVSQEFTIANPGGGNTDFTVSTKHPGVLLAVSSSTTPARVRVTVDPAVFQNNQGTTEALIEISSASAVNVPVPVRVLVNNREPDQRGTFFNVPGKLTDLVADPVRNRFYVLRQDRNEVQVFDASSYRQIGTMRTGNVPRHGCDPRREVPHRRRQRLAGGLGLRTGDHAAAQAGGVPGRALPAHHRRLEQRHPGRLPRGGRDAHHRPHRHRQRLRHPASQPGRV
jgi:hypothetical protein